MPALAFAFLVTALLYAAVGFGGGSTYAALLALSGLDYRVLPSVALLCNLVVVAGGTIRFARAGITPWRAAAPLVALGAPAAFAGALTPIGEPTFLATLATALLASGLLLLFVPAHDEAVMARASGSARKSWGIAAAAAPIGYLAGLVGIGGGIFLAPLLHLVRWAPARQVAATASLFILVNSLFGLAGQIAKGGVDRLAAAATIGLPLMLAVAVGGQVGGLLAQRKLPVAWIRRLTAVLVLAVAIRLLWQVMQGSPT